MAQDGRGGLDRQPGAGPVIITCGLISARSATVKVCTPMGALGASSDPSTAAASFTVVAGERLIIEIDAQAVVVEVRGDREKPRPTAQTMSSAEFRRWRSSARAGVAVGPAWTPPC